MDVSLRQMLEELVRDNGRFAVDPESGYCRGCGTLDIEQHEQDCIVTRARKMLEQE